MPYVGIHVTRASADLKTRKAQGTNTPTQKARAVQAICQILTDPLGNTVWASHVALHEVSAGAWGYDGHAQACWVASRDDGDTRPDDSP